MIDSLTPTWLVLGFLLGIAPWLPLHRTWARSSVILICGGLSIRYLLWRWTATLPTGLSNLEQLWMWTVFAVECVGYTSLAILLLVMTRRTDRAGEADRHEARLRALPPAELPCVDLLIPTYNEELEVLRRTIIGAKSVDYPNLEVYVLDDGRREWLRLFCREQGVHYVTRPDNQHAKAGNLNHGLRHARGEFFAVLDADFVPLPNFIFRTLGFFEDPRVGVVQTPQYFFNPDPIQCNLELREDWVDEQRLTFEDIQPCRDAWDTAYCCGSCSVLRRAAVDEAGGIPTESVTEDVLTTLVLLRRGYITRYLNEKLTHGLAPESLEAFFVQRSRWCRGGLQILFLEHGPFGRGLTPLQRLVFATVGLDWVVQCLIRLLVMAIPLAAIYCGLRPYEAVSTETFLFYLLPVWLSLKGVFFYLAPRRHFPLITTATWLLICIRILPAVLATLVQPFGAPFRVTPKGKDARQQSDRLVLGTTLALMLVFVVAMFLNRFPQFSLVDSALSGIASLFCLYNLALLLLVWFMAVELPRRKSEEWFAADEDCHLMVAGQPMAAGLTRISEAGAELIIRNGPPEEQSVSLEVSGVGPLPATIRSRRRQRVVVEFDGLPPLAHERLILKLFGGLCDNTVRQANPLRMLLRLCRRFLLGRR